LPIDELYAEPGHLIRRAQQIAVSIFMEECGASGITPVQYAALVAIGEKPGIDATRLSLLVAFDRSTLGNVLTRLEAKKLVRRTGKADDKRVKVLRLTREGEKLLKDVETSVATVHTRILAPLAPDDRERLMALLTQLVELNNEVSRAPLGTADQRR
jgi:DNA-binding MarR family transcriptional regulator